MANLRTEKQFHTDFNRIRHRTGNEDSPSDAARRHYAHCLTNGFFVTVGTDTSTPTGVYGTRYVAALHDNDGSRGDE